MESVVASYWSRDWTEVARDCQRQTNKILRSSNRIAFCASCCERIISDEDGNNIKETKVYCLHESFKVSSEQKKTIELMSYQFIKEYLMIYIHDECFYYLNLKTSVLLLVALCIHKSTQPSTTDMY